MVQMLVAGYMEKHIQDIEAQKTGGPLVLEIRGNSLDDGPGIRSVVFMKGCPLFCVWCHNPESKKPGPELLFDASICVSCGTCAELCESGALIMKKKSSFLTGQSATSASRVPIRVLPVRWNAPENP